MGCQVTECSQGDVKFSLHLRYLQCQFNTSKVWWCWSDQRWLYQALERLVNFKACIFTTKLDQFSHSPPHKPIAVMHWRKRRGYQMNLGLWFSKVIPRLEGAGTLRSITVLFQVGSNIPCSHCFPWPILHHSFSFLFWQYNQMWLEWEMYITREYCFSSSAESPNDDFFSWL